MESFFELNPKVFEFEKNVPKLKPQGVKIGEIGFKRTLGEPPNKFKVPSLGLKVFLKRKKPHNIHIHLFLCHFHFNVLSQLKYITIMEEKYCCFSP
jgi:hypothetical protein